jgi:hypothetical protein
LFESETGSKTNPGRSKTNEKSEARNTEKQVIPVNKAVDEKRITGKRGREGVELGVADPGFEQSRVSNNVHRPAAKILPRLDFANVIKKMFLTN